MKDARRTLGSKHHTMGCTGGHDRVGNKSSSDKHNIGALQIQQAFGLLLVVVQGPVIPEYVAALLPAYALGGGLGWV